MKDIIFKGCGTAMCTPFNDEDKIDFDELGRFVDFQIEEGIDALIVCGTTGESATMTEDEKKETIKYVIKRVNNRIPVIAGTGSNNTLNAVNMTKYACDVGASSALIVTPYYNKTTQEGLIEHYRRIAENTNIPIILYNVPSRTGVNIEPETCLELSKINNIVAIKEASGNITQISRISSLCKGNLHIYSGNDDQIVPVLSVGGIGVISVLSNIKPGYVHQMVNEYLSNNVNKATEMQLESMELIKLLFSEVNPIPVKYALSRIGFNFGKPRLPLVEMTEKNKEKLLKILNN